MNLMMGKIKKQVETVKWYETGGVENRPETYEVHSWVFMISEWYWPLRS